MSDTSEAKAWRNIVNSNPIEREAYNVNSLRDYVDAVMAYYNELVSQAEVINSDTEWQILLSLASFMDDQFEYVGEMGPIRIQGNGIYLPGDSDELKFLDGTKGISGEYAGFSIEEMPCYQDILYQVDAKYQTRSVLCIELKEWTEYSDSGIQLEPRGGTVSVPLEGQDIAFTRASYVEDDLSYYD